MRPILYSFRRCPYAIRARLAIKISGIEVEMREVDLRDKPRALVECSPKGTVPVLLLPDGTVIDESLDIMRWALAINDPETWSNQSAESLSLIGQNDGSFKRSLDRYKYPARFSEQSVEYYREQGEGFLRLLDERLTGLKYLMRDRPDMTDMAILPFVRQFAHVDKQWFYSSRYTRLIDWLDGLLRSDSFVAAMKK